MTETISFRLGKELENNLAKVERKWQVDRSEIIRRLLSTALKQWNLENAIERLAAHKISLGKAAEEAGISIWEMLDVVKERNIDWVGYDEEDLKKDLSLLK